VRRRDGNKQREKEEIEALQRYPFNEEERETMKFEGGESTRQLETITKLPASRMQTDRAQSLVFGRVQPRKEELMQPPLQA